MMTRPAIVHAFTTVCVYMYEIVYACVYVGGGGWVYVCVCCTKHMTFSHRIITTASFIECHYSRIVGKPVPDYIINIYHYCYGVK